MVKVPEYRPDVSLRPAFQQDVNVRASAESFGAATGRGLVGLARGMDSLSSSLQQVQDLEDTAAAKDADNAYASWMRERMYGEGGFMTLEGRNAVDQRKAFEEEAEQKRREFGAELRPGAAQKYGNASQSRLQSTLQQSIVHTANQRKNWFKDAGSARVQTFADDALTNYTKPGLVDKNIAAGLMEIRELGQMEGISADELKLREAQFISGVHKNVALRLAQDDPLAADAYIKENSTRLSGADQYALRKSLEPAIKDEQSKRAAGEILSLGRDVGPAEGAAGGTSAGERGPTRARAFLQSRSNKPASHVDGLDDSFAANLAAMIDDAPPGIREGLGIYSGYRSPEHQARLWQQALKKYGSAAAARKWVAPPGRSFHNSGRAVDLSYNGQSLKHAPKEVRDWVHQNAGNYGMYFPMGHEPWHIEPMGTRGNESADGADAVAPRSNRIAPRTTMPSFEEIERRLAGIEDDDVRELTRKRIYASLSAQNKAAQAAERAAKAELWSYIDQGATPDDVPFEVRQAAGMPAVSAAWSYIDTASRGRAVESDEELLYDMRRYAAVDPAGFAEVDLNEYRDRLSKEAVKELTGLQTGALTDQRKAREDGMTLTTAFSQAQSQLEAVGITTTGKKDSARQEAAARIARFQNALADEMQAFKEANDGRNPNQVDIQAMVNKLLLPIVIRDPGTFWDSETEGFAFEARTRPDGTIVEFNVEYTDIPIDLRRAIERDLASELGREPSEEEIVRRYEAFSSGIPEEGTPSDRVSGAFEVFGR